MTRTAETQKDQEIDRIIFQQNVATHERIKACRYYKEKIG